MNSQAIRAFLAGIFVGVGLALFAVFLVAQVGPISVPGFVRPGLGFVGLVLLVSGFVWMIRIRSNPVG